MPDETHVYCGHCGRYLGTREIPQCPYCGVIFTTTEHLGTITRTITKSKLDTRKLKYTVVASAGIGGCLCSATLALSVVDQTWKAFFASLARSFTWQISIMTVVFFFLFSAFKVLFWEQVDHLLLKLNNWRLYELRQKLKRLFAPLARHRRAAIIFFVLVASVASIPTLAAIFKRPLDGYEIGFNVAVNVVAWVFTSVIDDLLKQKEQIEQQRHWTPPPTLAEWERME
jgi:hypothetical protein